MDNLVDLTSVPTALLIRELQYREGVYVVDVDPYEHYTFGKDGRMCAGTGPAILLLVED